MATVTLDRVEKAYGGTRIIEALSLDVTEGEFLVLIGPSGCGKSSLLRMIAGLEELTGGSIAIGARDVSNVAPRERNVAMVFQSYALYPNKTVAQNMAFPLLMNGTPHAEAREKVARAAEVLGLGALMDRKPRQLSGGQRQRVAMGRAIVRDPDVFLFDEPLSNLDAKLRVQMRSEIKALHRRLGTTTVYVTHDQVEAMTMGSRIVVLNGGRIEQAGTPAELYERPVSLFVAEFIGSPKMNILRGSIAAAEGAAVLGIRPEHLTLAASDAGTWQGRVTDVEHLGSESYVTVRLDPETDLLVRVPGMQTPAPGEAVSLNPDRTCLHRFDTDGQRIAPLSVAG